MPRRIPPSGYRVELPGRIEAPFRDLLRIQCSSSTLPSMKTHTLLLAFALPSIAWISDANAAVTLSKDLRGATTWDTFTVTTEPSTAATTFVGVTDTNTVGLGQSFTATASGNIDAISFGVTRMYAGLDGVVNVYQMFDGDGVTPGANPTRFRNGNPDWMSDAIATIPFNTTTVNINSSGDGNNMYTFNLSGTDLIPVSSGATYMVSIEGAGSTGNNLVFWDKVDSGTYAAGTYGVPDGGTTTVGGRDALLAVNISPVPEPSAALLGGLGLLGLLRRRRG